jgi:hypothetical protein
MQGRGFEAAAASWLTRYMREEICWGFTNRTLLGGRGVALERCTLSNLAMSPSPPTLVGLDWAQPHARRCRRRRPADEHRSAPDARWPGHRVLHCLERRLVPSPVRRVSRAGPRRERALHDESARAGDAQRS